MSLDRKITKLGKVIEVWNQRLEVSRGRRLVLGLSLFFLLVASQIWKGFYLELIAVLILLPAFVYFFRKSRRQGAFLERLQNLKHFYEHQRNFQQGLFTKSYRPEEMYDPDLARDLDLGLLYAALDFCCTDEASKRLNQWLCQHFSNSNLTERQQKLKELLKFPSLLRRLHMAPIRHRTRLANIETDMKRSFLEHKAPWKWLIPVAWVMLLATLIIQGEPAFLWKALLFAYVALSMSFMNQTAGLFSRLQDLQKDFEELNLRIGLFERLAQGLNFAPSLKGHQASHDVAKLERLISLASLRTNPIIYFVINLLVPWDLVFTELSERRRQKFFKNFRTWGAELVEIDTIGQLANLKLYHRTIWATPNQKGFLSFTDLCHPLLNQATVIPNSFDPGTNRIIIITGSNMSGKSTFLRAVGLNFTLANIGAPVFAKSFQFQAMPLISCIRVSDSLRDGQSYFYAEVQRMKRILTNAKNEATLFLIDEPLRGTNNKERLIGNKSYLQQMLKSQGQGFLSTHDLELTQLAEGSDQIINYHFSDDWSEERWVFDYKIKQGPSQSTNALKILKQENLYDGSL